MAQKKKLPLGLTPGKARFALDLQTRTGLWPRVIYAWILAENGPDDNPLNVVPGRHYGTPQKAAEVTANLLKEPRYAGVISSVGQHSEDAQLRAIERSPFNLDKNHKPKPAYLQLLRGTLARVKQANVVQPVSAVDEVRQIAAAPANAARDVANVAESIPHAITGAVKDVEGFVVKESVIGLSYLLLTGAALAFFVLGAMRVTGTSPVGLARAGATAGEKGEIPF